MTLPDCVRVARGVFVDASTLYFRDLIATVKSQARKKCSARIRQLIVNGLVKTSLEITVGSPLGRQSLCVFWSVSTLKRRRASSLSA